MSDSIKRLTIFFFAGAFIACDGNVPPETRGKAAYASYDCKRCHRIGDEGGTTGPDLTYVGFRKTEEFLDRWLKDPSAWQPNTMMPNFHFNDGTRKVLAAYLAAQKGQAYHGSYPWDAPGLRADPLKRGQMIYERVGCVTCHGKAGVGGYRNNNVIGGMVPSLIHAADGFTKEELITRIDNGVRHPVKADPLGPDPMLFMPAWKEVLRPADVDAVAEYVLSFKPKSSSKDQW